MLPVIGYNSLAINFRRVDLPDPFPPTNATLEPRDKEKFTWEYSIFLG